MQCAAAISVAGMCVRTANSCVLMSVDDRIFRRCGFERIRPASPFLDGAEVPPTPRAVAAGDLDSCSL
jgi:hypothetical protein